MKKAALLTVMAAASLLTTTVLAQEKDAKVILKTMSDYVASQKTIELSFDSDIEVITPVCSQPEDHRTVV